MPKYKVAAPIIIMTSRKASQPKALASCRMPLATHRVMALSDKQVIRIAQTVGPRETAACRGD
jgi:hypothetical protein